MAIRLSLGASRTRLFRQMLTESILLALGGGTLGLLVASGGVRALLWVAREDFIRTEQIHLNPTVVAFTFFVSMLTGVGFGLIPALHISRFRGALQTEAHKTVSTGRQRVKNVLVVVELAVSLVLSSWRWTAGAKLYYFVRDKTGFQNHGLLTAGIHLSLNKYKTQPELDAFFDRLIEKLDGVPGVESAAVTMPLEFSGENWGYGFLVDGDPYPAPAKLTTRGCITSLLNI